MPDRLRTCYIFATGLILFAAPAYANPRLTIDATGVANVQSGSLSAELSQLGTPPKLVLSDLDQRTLELLEKDQSEAAQKLIVTHLANARGPERAHLLYQLAWLNFQAANYRIALHNLGELLREPIRGSSGPSSLRAYQLKHAGDCYYRMRRRRQALSSYKDALLLAERDKLEPLQVDILEALTCCLMEKAEYAEAKSYAESLLLHCRNLCEEKQLTNIGILFWSEVSLLQIYEQLGEEANYQKLRNSFIPLLQYLMHFRSQLNAPLGLTEELTLPLRVKTIMLTQYVAQHEPKSLPDFLWLISSHRLRELPLISWEPSGGGKAKAAILCVHALGLENRAFEPFAKRMVAHNFAVFAMDVRGFGSWQSEMGTETVNFERTLSDIHAVIAIIKELSPRTPVFLLGESMGGALVLRGASGFGSELSGVISSVPSAERYQESRMAFRVATHLLRHPSKPFSMAEQLGVQATTNRELRAIWEVDPLAKQKFSAVELIKVSRFMTGTVKKCKEINSTPVLFVQGLADRLVKPKGTYQMFDNVGSTDKAMIIIGGAEHLIFENPKQPDVLLDGLTAWLNGHIGKTNVSVRSSPW